MNEFRKKAVKQAKYIWNNLTERKKLAVGIFIGIVVASMVISWVV